MTYYNDIYEHAVDRHYLFTTLDARDLGIPAIELAKLAHRGRLESLGNGVYRLARNVPSESDPYAVAVARAGEGAFLFGESVIALLGLAPTNPEVISVATTRRVRRALPGSVRLVRVKDPGRLAAYEGIPCQRAKDAIAACKGAVMTERLRDAARRGVEQGYITAREAEELEVEMGW
jgi:hypothetical protein